MRAQLSGEVLHCGRQPGAVDDGHVGEGDRAALRPLGARRVGGQRALRLLWEREVLEQPLERREVRARLRHHLPRAAAGPKSGASIGGTWPITVQVWGQVRAWKAADTKKGATYAYVIINPPASAERSARVP